ncbi:hypothetical protein PCI56_18285 [Plesiomonas shigelloides subsp. oncorhynchi]|nr:hypothetical protein [Plesiomonas shigelloides]
MVAGLFAGASRTAAQHPGQHAGFFGAIAICCHTDLVFTAPRCFADHVCRHYPLVQRPLPLNPSPVAYQMLWHERHEQDAGHRWLRDFLSRHLTRPPEPVL